jgi:SAM-dependent methyltransferase
VLDVGCGSGTDTIPSAHVVGPARRVVGIDHEAGRMAEANQRAAEACVGAWVHHFWGDALTLPFQTGSFAACRSERLLQHRRNPRRRAHGHGPVARAGGWIVVLERDGGTLSVDTGESEIERRIARFETERMRQNRDAEGQLYRLFKGQPLVDIVLEMRPDYTTHYPFMRQVLQLEDCESRALTCAYGTARRHTADGHSRPTLPPWPRPAECSRSPSAPQAAHAWRALPAVGRHAVAPHG